MDFSADTLLLSTKLKIPAPRKNYVVRGALFEKLSQCGDMSVIFVKGGAGTGKTTLLSSFIREKQLHNVCWISLDALNANLYSFWLYFTAAVSALLEDGGNMLALVRSNPDPSHIENMLVILINRLCGEEDYYMVLDDVHCIGDAGLIKTLEFFLNSMPSNFHLFMLSREEPPVYLGPLAVSGRLLFIDGSQMQLSAEEGVMFLKTTLGLSGSDLEFSEINSYAEGWIGGLQLAAAAKSAGRSSGNKLLSTGGGIAAEYLTREVLESLETNERDFLISTGFVSYFDAGICMALFECFTGDDFSNMIDTLLRKNLFIICIDEQNGIYRYHNIFSDYLVQRFAQLPQERKQKLYINAAAAFEKRMDYEEALRLYNAAGLFEDILRVAQAMDGKIEAWSYLDKVPLDILITNIDLASQCFIYNIGNMNIERCRALYEKFKEHYKDKGILDIMQFADPYISGLNGILPKYRAVTAEQIELFHLGPTMKAMALVQNAAALVEHLQYEEAENCINKALENAGTNIFVKFFAYDQLAQVYEETGRLREGLASYKKAEELLSSPSMLSAAGINFCFGLVGVYMRRMELDRAQEILERAEHLMDSQHAHIDISDMTLLYHLAEMEFLRGEDEAGASYVDFILSEYPNFSVLTLGRLLQELDCAEMLPSELGDDFLKEINMTEEYRSQPFMRLLEARLLYKRGKLDEALSETEEILIFSRLHKNSLRLVEAGLLKVLMLADKAKAAAAQREISNLMREAVHYAYQDRILMPFYLDRSALLPLMKELLSQAAGKNILNADETDFLRDAISICGSTITTAKEPDTLSSRELEVLSKMAMGITNREIADKLCISQATVKTHALNIFGKLGVSSRMAAVDAGRRKGLIQQHYREQERRLYNMDLIPIKLSVTNCFLLRNGESFVLIDTGYEEDWELFREELKRKNVEISQISHIILTHHHDDHCGLLHNILRDNPSIRIVMSELCAKLIAKGENDQTHGGGLLNKRVAFLIKNKQRYISLKTGKKIDKAKNLKFTPYYVRDCDIIVQDGTALRDIGITVDGNLIATPGHTVDSISLLFPDGTCLVGDAAASMLGFAGTKNCVIFICNMEEYYGSWRKIIGAGAKKIYPAHGQPFSVDRLTANMGKNQAKNLVLNKI